MIVGLGLGGSGQDIDTTSPISEIQTRSASINQLNINTLKSRRKRRDAHARFTRSIIYGSGTRCPHRNSAGQVCQHLSGTSLTRLNSYACMHSSILRSRVQYTVSLLKFHPLDLMSQQWL